MMEEDIKQRGKDQFHEDTEVQIDQPLVHEVLQYLLRQVHTRAVMYHLAVVHGICQAETVLKFPQVVSHL
jgi:hypothetical protein